MFAKERESVILDKDFNFEEAKKRKGYYSEYKLFKKFDSISRILKKSGAKILYPAIILYLVLTKSNAPIQTKITIISSLGYLISPIDCIPDAIFAIGLGDDFSALYIAVSNIKSYITEKIKNEAKSIVSTWINEITINELLNIDRLLKI